MLAVNALTPSNSATNYLTDLTRSMIILCGGYIVLLLRCSDSHWPGLDITHGL